MAVLCQHQWCLLRIPLSFPRKHLFHLLHCLSQLGPILRIFKKLKELKDHLASVARGIQSRFHKVVDFNNSTIPNSLLIALGICHDIGKYTEWFQDYLLDNRNSKSSKKNHALLSAIFAFHYIKLISANKDTFVP